MIESVKPPGLYIVPPTVPLAPPLGQAWQNRAQVPLLKPHQRADWAKKWIEHFQNQRIEEYLKRMNKKWMTPRHLKLSKDANV